MRPQWEGGRWRKGGGGAGESSCNTSQRASSTPAYPSASFHIFSSHIHLFISPAPPPLPPSLFFPSPLFPACPHSHCRCLTQHTISPLCISRHLKEKVAQKTPNIMHKFDAWLLVCLVYFPLHELFCVYFGINL